MTDPMVRRRAGTAAVLVLLGAATAVAGWLGGGGVWAAVALVAAFAVVAAAVFVWSGRSDTDLPALLGGVGDERQQMLDLRATAVAGLAMGLFCLVLALVHLARGEDNPWLVVCAVGAVSYAAALVVLKARG
jgi:hypothetical protein